MKSIGTYPMQEVNCAKDVKIVLVFTNLPHKRWNTIYISIKIEKQLWYVYNNSQSWKLVGVLGITMNIYKIHPSSAENIIQGQSSKVYYIFFS